MGKRLLIIVLSVLVLLTACEANDNINTQENNTQDNTITGTNEPTQQAEIEQDKKGTRLSPLPINTTAVFDGMNDFFYTFKAEVTLTEVIRGADANKKVKEANMFNEEPGEGKEYLLAKLKIKALESKDDAKIDINSSLFELVSEPGNKYDDFVVASDLEPSLKEMYAGAQQEGYVCFLVDKNDVNPSIVFLESIDAGIWFSLK